MKTVILHNVDIDKISWEAEAYLHGGRVTCAICKSSHALMEYNPNRKNVIFLMWNDRIYNEASKTFDENLSPSPIDRVCDFIRDIFIGHPSFEIDHLCNFIKYMNCEATIHYDINNYTFDVK